MSWPAAIVLAGGESSRMGQSKAWIELAGQTLLARVVSTLRQSCAQVVVVARAGQSLPDHGGRRVDETGAWHGPLAGLEAGLSALGDADCCFVSGVDAPLLSGTHIDFVMSRLDEDAVVPEHNGILEPLAAAMRVAPARQICRELLAQGERRLHPVFAELRTRVVMASELPDLRVLAPCNTPAELARLRELAT
jgi:molybdenum cofactor guanylyltransferase